MSVYAFSRNIKCLCIHLHSSLICVYIGASTYTCNLLFMYCASWCVTSPRLWPSQLWLGVLSMFFLLEKHGESWRGWYCWWFRNPANQLRLVVYPIIYDGFYTSQVVGNGIPSINSRCRYWKHGSTRGSSFIGDLSRNRRVNDVNVVFVQVPEHMVAHLGDWHKQICVFTT